MTSLPDYFYLVASVTAHHTSPFPTPTSFSALAGPHPSAPPVCHTSSSCTIDAAHAARLHPVADASAGWQHHNQLVDPLTRALGSASPTEAPTEGLLGWTQQMQQSEEQLMEKVSQSCLDVYF